jgi:hypothetical protein
MRELTKETCPICGARGEVRSLGAFGFASHCSCCYEGDPESERWRRLQGHGATAEDAIEKWLEDGRELCAVDEIPPLRIRYELSRDMWTDLQRQVAMEGAAQKGLDLVQGWRWVTNEQTGNRSPEDILYAEFHA